MHASPRVPLWAMALTELPPEIDYLDLPLREKRRRLAEMNGEDLVEIAEVCNAPAPACSVCQAPLEPDRVKAKAKTCARGECVHEARARRRRNLLANGGGRRRQAAATAGPPPATNGAAMHADPSGGLEPVERPPEAANGHGAEIHHGMTDLGPPDRLGPIYRALMLAGASVVRVDVTVDRETWRIERVTTERTGT